MRESEFTGGAYEQNKDFMGDKAKTKPYSFLKAPSCLAGAYDEIVLPRDHTEFDWEVELALAIGRPGRRIPAERAMAHVAGFMTTNDVSCRDAQWRPDRQTLRSDWIGGKSYDTFAPMGPFFVPRAFVLNHMDLRLTLAVNGEVMQNGTTAGLIFSPEEQIEYFSRGMTLEAGDVFATGTPGGVGQGRGRFLKAGDIVECEVQGLGRQRNRVVSESV
jgi:2,4-didehydro-3-deoxy-L-rhamnonate hydrolase